MPRPSPHKGLPRPQCSSTGWSVRFWVIFLFCMCIGTTISSPQVPTHPAHKPALAPDQDHTDLVTQEIRYFAPGASEVYLVWGINGRQPVAESIRPPGTWLDENKVMNMQMVRAGNIFTATLQIPRGSRLDYNFVVAIKKGDGTPDVWRDEPGYGSPPFVKEATCGGRIEIQSAVTTALPVTAEQRKAWLAGDATDIPLVTQTIIYNAA